MFSSIGSKNDSPLSFQSSKPLELYSHITFREYEYLEYIRKKNLSKYKIIIEKLKEKKLFDYSVETEIGAKICTKNKTDYI